MFMPENSAHLLSNREMPGEAVTLDKTAVKRALDEATRVYANGEAVLTRDSLIFALSAICTGKGLLGRLYKPFSLGAIA